MFKNVMVDSHTELPNLSQTNLLEAINEACEKYANNNAFSYLGCDYRFADIDKYSKRFASWLQNQTSLVAGDRIAIKLPNVIHYPIAAIGAIRAGLVIVNTNPLYTARELTHQFSDSGAKALVVLDSRTETVNKILADTDIDTVITVNATDLFDEMSAALSNAETSIAFGQIISSNFETSYQELEVAVNELALLQYTGGTTGAAKGAMLSHKNLLSNIYQVTSRLASAFVEGREKLVLPLPLYHIFAFNISYMYFFKGNCSILIPNPSDLEQFVDLIKTTSFTAFAGINTLLIGLSNNENFKLLDFSSLKLTITGGAATTLTAIDEWQKLTGCKVSEGWGLSESSPAITLNPPTAPQYGCAGLPVIGTELKIIADDGTELSSNKEGEIWAKGPQIMMGYWQQPEATAETITDDGWLKTGDIGYIREDGFVKLVDRKKDMIIVSGFNVYPNELEDVISSHDDVMEVAVIGVPNNKTGEAIRAYVVLKSGKCENLQTLTAHCNEHLTRYKVPREIIFTSSVPKSPVGKILRRELREQVLAELGSKTIN